MFRREARSRTGSSAVRVSTVSILSGVILSAAAFQAGRRILRADRPRLKLPRNTLTRWLSRFHWIEFRSAHRVVLLFRACRLADDRPLFRVRHAILLRWLKARIQRAE